MFFVSLISNFLAIPIAFILNIMLNFIIKIAEITANMPLSKIIIITPSIFFIICWYVIITAITYKTKVKRLYYENRKLLKIIVVCILVISLISNLIIIFNRNLKIYFINVGQGDSCLIVTPSNKKILIDGGGSEFGSFNVGEKTLLPYLLDRKIISLDYIIISHFDSDHVGAVLYLLQKIKIKNIIIGKQFEISENYKEFMKIVKEKNIKVYIVNEGQKINIEKNLYFYVLWPSSEEAINENSINNNSLVCKMQYLNFSILFTGDIEELAERIILEKYSNTNILKSTVLKVAHHGSKSSSIGDFLNKVEPKIALIGVGENNNFGHPNEGVLYRLKRIYKQNI